MCSMVIKRRRLSMRLLLLVTISFAYIGYYHPVSSQSTSGRNTRTLVFDGIDADTDENTGFAETTALSHPTGHKLRKKQKNHERRKRGRGKGRKSGKSKNGKGPTPSPSSNDENSFKMYVDGDDHDLPPDEYTGIMLERGTALTIGSGVSIESKALPSNLDSAISVTDSSLKIQGDEISIIGSSHVHNSYGVGGNAISYLDGSKGMIGCDAMEPPSTPPGTCRIGSGALIPAMSFCSKNEFCVLREGECNSRIGMHSGDCKKIPIACTMNMDPVCGCDGNDYSNECAAHVKGVSVSRKGKCGGYGSTRSCDVGGGSENASPICLEGEFCQINEGECDWVGGDVRVMGKCAPRPEVCPKQLRPVCGCDEKTYTNDCQARVAGVNVSTNGECTGGPSPTRNPSSGPFLDCQVGRNVGRSDCSKEEFCELEEEEICNFNDNEVHWGKCKPRPAACNSADQPVCGCDGKTYSSKCLAHDKGVSIIRQGRCGDPKPARQCEVGPKLLPMCQENEFCELDEGICNRRSETHRGKCKPMPPICTSEIRPVCGCDGNTHSNECGAHGKGVSISRQGGCDGPGPARQCEVGPKALPSCYGGEFCELDVGVCNRRMNGKIGTNKGKCSQRPDACIEIYQPVCGCDGFTYSNDCMARSKGVSVSRQGDCDRDPPEPPTCPLGKCLNPKNDKCTNKQIKCPANPCSARNACKSGQKCTPNYCGGCNAICTDPPEEDPCEDMKCFADPCQVKNPCGPEEKCNANYCGGCNAVCTSPTMLMAEKVPELESSPLEEVKIPVRPGVVRASCDDDGIHIIGGEGDIEAEGGSGRGGVALRVYGQTTRVDINGATLIGGDGSIKGYALEIAEAEVTIHSAVMDGEVLVAKRATLNIYGGSFSDRIEVLGDTSLVTFHGCIDSSTKRDGEGYEHWTFQFNGMDEMIQVIVNDGGEIGWETEQCDKESLVVGPTESPAASPDVFTRL